MRAEPQSKNYSALISDIEARATKIPQFQRESVWSKEKSAHLLDSIIKGYPIGTFITWRTRENLRSVRNIGGANLPEPPAGNYVDYVLDGQQRLTSLFASIKGLCVIRDGRDVNFLEIYVDLMASEHERIVITDVTEREPKDYIKFKELIDGNILKISQKYPTQVDRIQKYRDKLIGCHFSLISITEAPIDIATEIFARINQGGKPLTVFEIMVAKMLDDSKNFDLSKEYDALVNDRLTRVGYETTSSATLLQLMAVLLTTTKECRKQHILNLSKDDFIKEWPKAVDAFEKAIDYFRTHFRIPVSRLLPYNALLIPFAYFFYHHPDRPTVNSQRYLTDFFWRVSLSGRYSSSLESKLAQDIKKIDSIIKGEQPDYDFPVDCTAKFIQKNGTFRASSSYIKALLCLLVFFEPKSFKDKSKVNVDNAWLKQANSKNYHHFFPRSYLGRRGVNDKLANHIANITIVDDYLNKRDIGATSPSEYMENFSNENPDIRETMETHLIKSDSKAIKDNDYEEFIKERCEWFSIELNKRVIPQQIDQNSVVLPDEEDAESEEMAA